MVGMKKLKVCWMSAGVSSFMAGYLSRETIDEFIYIDIKDQHPDFIRFIKDCEKVLGKPINPIPGIWGCRYCLPCWWFYKPTEGWRILHKVSKKESPQAVGIRA